MFCTEHIARGNGLRDPFAYNGYALKLGSAAFLGIVNQGYMRLEPIGIKGQYGAFEINSGGIVPVIQPSRVMRGSVPLSLQPNFSPVPPWALPSSKM